MFRYQDKLHTIPVYIDILKVEWKADGSVDYIQVNQVFQPFEYLTGDESFYKPMTMPGDKIPIEVMGVIQHEYRK